MIPPDMTGGGVQHDGGITGASDVMGGIMGVSP